MESICQILLICSLNAKNVIFGTNNQSMPRNLVGNPERSTHIGKSMCKLEDNIKNVQWN
jgi:hypothetical protein